jgi:BlaI family transcriptional regulator, penicillinase repressor
MPKKSLQLPGGDLEYAVMFTVCELDSASARDVHMRVRESDGLAYTTIAKVLDRLHLKGLVARKRRGRAFVYRARVARQVIELNRARAILGKLLAYDLRPAMATLVEAMESLNPEVLDELERAVAARRETRDEP